MPLKPLEQPSYDLTVDSAVSYRVALPVTRICRFRSGDYYPVCPRCDETLEREYMAYCDRCGQHLSWKQIRFAQIISSPVVRTCRDPHKK